MALINYATKEINVKIVYYGPGLGGKTTNLRWIYGKLDAEAKGKMITLATEMDRTLFFDFLPVDLGSVRGFETRFHLYTVPGQVFYNASRRIILRGSDGIIFVADSQNERREDNIDSLNNLKENLATFNLSLDETPYVMQYNKRDLPNIMTVSEMEELLNPRGVPYFESVATQGIGVFETLKEIAKMVIRKF
ncbi:gliding-motility protein MglA [candidate division WOR-3 bacterium]|uniref:Gliding-motility protein MglA n=1 Tax=candidate division WOR-3 bacterium TaxID=2052148 RepID=A0A9D5KAI3_UNCW3|nr:gliding-motility protein MglA [candidate division WOR-3 bacterium]MBD3365252.1 gliding-motility protein MglA [candidate division WOR-3 bacterium]